MGRTSLYDTKNININKNNKTITLKLPVNIWREIQKEADLYGLFVNSYVRFLLLQKFAFKEDNGRKNQVIK